MRKCEHCDYNFLKQSKDRPLFCHSCELRDKFYEVMPDLPGYNLLKNVVEKINRIFKTIERMIFNEK